MTLEELVVKISADTAKFTKGIAAATAAASASFAAVGKAAVESFADYEQLAGGVNKIFEGAADEVMTYAQQAYKTAGISANQYMEQVTSFSAALKQSYGDVGDAAEKAAKTANMAIQDMADNANTYGSSMESIQNAYQGFAKQNYTMLDNLKLGYGGTKSEMERLLVDAEKLSGIHYDISNLDDVYQAIHVIQQEMNITGTTAAEASGTISGSINSMKAAWDNMLVSFASGDNTADMVQTFVDSVITVGDNLIPVVEQIITSLFEVIKERLPGLVENLFNGLGEILPDYLQPLVGALEGLFNFIVENKEVVIAALAGISAGLKAFEIATTINNVLGGITTFFSTIQAGTGIVGVFNAVMAANPLGVIAVAVGAVVAALVLLITHWDEVKETASNCWKAISETWGKVKDWFKNSVITPITTLFSQCWDKVWTSTKNVLNKIIGGFENMINGVIRGLNKLLSPLRGAGNKLLSFLGIDFTIPSFSSVSLPRLAKGGIAYGDTLARVGDYAGASTNPEVIAPLSKLSSLIDNASVVDRLDTLITVVSSKEFKAYISKNEVGKASVDYIKQQNRILGGAII